MPDTTLVVQVEDELGAAFAEAARAADRSSADLIRDLMRDFVSRRAKRAAYDAWFAKKVAVSRAAAERGELVDHATVEAEMAQRRATALRRARERGV